MLQTVTFGLKTQHFRRKGEEVFSIEAEPNDWNQRRNQEEEDKSTDEQERAVPKHLPRCVIDWHTFTILTGADPCREPAHRKADKKSAKQTANTAENCRDDAEKHGNAPDAFPTLDRRDLCQNTGQCRTNNGAADQPDPWITKDVAGDKAEHRPQYCHDWHREGQKVRPFDFNDCSTHALSPPTSRYQCRQSCHSTSTDRARPPEGSNPMLPPSPS